MGTTIVTRISSLLVAAMLIPAGAAAQDAAGARAWLDGRMAPAASQSSYDGPPITVRISTFLNPAVKLVSDVWQPAFERLAKESNGKLVVKAFYGGTLHGLPEGFKAAREGITDITHCMIALDPGNFRLMHGLTMPFVFQDAAVATLVAHDIYAKYLRKEYEAQGVYLARIAMTPPYNILTKRPVATLDDFKGMKVRSGGGLQADVIKGLGGVPLNIRSSELFTAFQRGVIDGVVFHDAAFVSFKAFEEGKYRTELKLLSNSAEYCMNRRFFDALPADLKPVLSRWLQELAQAEAQIYYDEFGAKAREQMQAKGIETVTIAAGELAAWKARVKPVVDAFVAKHEAEGLPARQMVEDMIRLTEKYAKMSSEERMRQVVARDIPALVSN